MGFLGLSSSKPRGSNVQFSILLSIKSSYTRPRTFYAFVCLVSFAIYPSSGRFFMIRPARHLACPVHGARTANATPKMLTFKMRAKFASWHGVERRGKRRRIEILGYAIAKGEGGVYLRLSPEQYARLSRP